MRSLRKRLLIESYRQNVRHGTYWGIRSNVSDYSLADPLSCPPDKTLILANTPTRLKRLEPDAQERLINWGAGEWGAIEVERQFWWVAVHTRHRSSSARLGEVPVNRYSATVYGARPFWLPACCHA